TLALADAKSARHDALRDLRAFASAQELFRERHGRFATGADVHAAPVTGGLRFAWHRGIEPIAIRTAPNGWSAEVRLSSGTRCALVVDSESHHGVVRA
nr:hypothetical protein [Gemmatimonadaceae bacterium]